MANFFAELRRRNIFRVGAAYAVVAWISLQLVNNLTPALRLPEWASSLVVLLLMVGFPVALIFTWARELPLEVGATQPAASTRLDWFLSSSLVVVFALVMYQQFAPARIAETPQAQAVPLPVQAVAVSVAVLPFVNLSSDPEQEFFSDGMTEEITSALARVPALTVIGRTSAFQFKGKAEDLRAIGQALNASYLIEGSVRKAGMQVRITAQLIRADTGAHLWTESYDRELKDVFATQEDIATAIAGALQIPLGLRQGETLIASRTDDLNSYEQYLRARALYRTRFTGDAIKLLEPLVQRDPGFAAAWGLLAEVYIQARPLGNTFLDQAERTAREAIRLDPRNAPAYAALADVDSFRGRWTVGEDGFRRALALDPNEPDIIDRYSTRLAVAGRIKEALSLKEKLQTLEPFVPGYKATTARFMASAGQTQAAITILEKTADTTIGNGVRNVALARAYAMEGRYADAADTLLAIPPQSILSRRSIEDAARLLRSAPQKVGSPEDLPALEGNLNFVYAYIGALDRVLENPEREVEFGTSLDALWMPESAPLRKTERFKKFVRDSDLVDYWRARGWPEFCRPMGADDFVCD